MKKRFILWPLLAMLSCQAPAVTPSPEPSGDTVVSEDPASADPVSEDPAPKTPVLAAPTQLTLTEQGEGILLTWQDNSIKEEGYLIERQTAKKTDRIFLPPDSQQWEDPEVTTGVWTYTVKAYKGLERGEGASVEYTKAGLPQLRLAVQTSWYMASARVDVLSDGGIGCSVEAGVEGEQVQTAPGTLKTGDSYYFNFRNLPQGKALNLYARLTVGSHEARQETSVTLPADPAPLKLSWTAVKDYGFPASVGLYRCAASLSGKTVNLWYASADLSAGDVALRTLKGGSSLKTLTDFVKGNLQDETVYVVTNGGYFASPGSSYSYIVDEGVELAKNVSGLNRTQSYQVTRGAFALDADNAPSLAWVYNGTATWAYDRPLPVFDGGPVLRCTAEYPAPVLDWHPQEAMGGGPILVKDGRFCFDYLKSLGGKYLSNSELMQSDIFDEGLRAPRTAVGYTDDGKVILLIADGRNAGGSAGLTLDELARIMLGLGCRGVLNLDGGGSTMMTVGNQGTLLNHPSDGKQRSVYSYMAIVAK